MELWKSKNLIFLWAQRRRKVKGNLKTEVNLLLDCKQHDLLLYGFLLTLFQIALSKTMLSNMFVNVAIGALNSANGHTNLLQYNIYISFQWLSKKKVVYFLIYIVLIVCWSEYILCIYLSKLCHYSAFPSLSFTHSNLGIFLEN